MGLILHSLLLLPVLGASATLPQQESFSPNDLPKPSDAIVIDLTTTTTMAQLIDSYCEVTGIRILVDPETHTLATSKAFTGFGKQLVLKPGDVQSFFESTLASQNFRLARMSHGDFTTFTLLSADTGLRRSFKSGSPFTMVESKDLHLWAGHDAILVQSTIEVEGVDMRQVGTNLRPLFSDPNFQSIMSAGSTNSLIFQGTGSQVAAVSELLQTIGKRARAENERSAELMHVAEQGMLEQEIEAASHTQGAITVGRVPKVSITPIEKRPHLTTAVLEISTDLREVTSVLEELSATRHNAENAHRIWFTADDGTQVLWPRPRMTFVRKNTITSNASGSLIVQATTDDLAWVQKAIGLIMDQTVEEK